DDTLMWRVVRHEAAEVRDVGQGHRYLCRELHRRRAFARRPGFQDLALGVVERGGDGMLAPQPRPVGRSMALMRFLAPRHGNALSSPGGAVQLGRSVWHSRRRRLPRSMQTLLVPPYSGG